MAILIRKTAENNMFSHLRKSRPASVVPATMLIVSAALLAFMLPLASPFQPPAPSILDAVNTRAAAGKTLSVLSAAGAGASDGRVPFVIDRVKGGNQILIQDASKMCIEVFFNEGGDDNQT